MIVSQTKDTVDFSERLGCRVVNLVPIDRVSEGVTRVTIHTSAVGIWPDSLKDKIRDG